MSCSREEAVEGIDKIIRNAIEMNFWESEELAEDILTFLEKEIKMIPPSIFLEVFNRYDNGWKDE